MCAARKRMTAMTSCARRKNKGVSVELSTHLFLQARSACYGGATARNKDNKAKNITTAGPRDVWRA